MVPVGGDGHAVVDVAGTLRAQTVESTNPLRHRMYPDNPLVYQDIFKARDAQAVTTLGSPQYNETSWPANNPWKLRPIIRFGSNHESDGNGAQVAISRVRHRLDQAVRRPMERRPRRLS